MLYSYNIRSGLTHNLKAKSSYIVKTMELWTIKLMSISPKIIKISQKFLQVSAQKWNAYNCNFLHLLTFRWPWPSYLNMGLIQALLGYQLHVNDKESNYGLYKWKIGISGNVENLSGISKRQNYFHWSRSLLYWWNTRTFLVCQRFPVLPWYP